MAQKAMVEVRACQAAVQVVLTDGWKGDGIGCLKGREDAYKAGLAINARVTQMLVEAAARAGPKEWETQPEGQHAGHGSPGH